MKKIYIAPNMKAMQMEAENVLAGSVLSNNGIGYGGIDTEGTKDPSVKANIFDENPFE